MRQPARLWWTVCLLAAGVGAQETQPGVELRLYDVGQSMSRVPRLVEGQLPNVHRILRSIDLDDQRRDFGELQDRFVTELRARLMVPHDGSYGLRLNADDGGLVYLNGRLVINHDGLHAATPKDTTLYLYQGAYDLEVRHFEEGGNASVKLSWKPPHADNFVLIEGAEYQVPVGLSLATAPGPKKILPQPTVAPGDGAPVVGVHPGYRLAVLRPAGYEPPVAGLAWDGEGQLAVLSRGEPGALHRLDGVLSGNMTASLLASDQREPVGLLAQGDQFLVLSSRGYERISAAGREVLRQPADGDIYRAGPVVLGDAVYAISSRADLAGAARAELVRLDEPATLLSDAFEPLGLAATATSLLATDLAGGEGPGGRLVEYARDAEGKFSARLVAWLPPEVVTQPTQPAVCPAGPFAGQVFLGDMAGGGVRRLHRDGPNATLFQFTQGLEAGVSRLLFAPDGSLIVGGDGGSAAWGELGKPGFGLQRLSASGQTAFEIQAVRCFANGLELEFSQPLPARKGWDPGEYVVTSYRYEPTAVATKRSGERRLAAVSASVSDDRRKVFLELPDLLAGQVVHLRLARALKSATNASLWSTEAWTTLTTLPATRGEVRTPPEGLKPNTLTAAEQAEGWRLLFDGETPKGWRGFRKKEFPAKGWAVEGGTLHCTNQGGGDLITEEAFGSFELQIEWRITPGANSGLMYRVTEEVSPSFFSGPEIQVADDGQGSTSKHSVGAMYDLYETGPKRVNPPGEWNLFRITMRGNQVEHQLNGESILKYEIGSEDWVRRVEASKFKGLPKFGTERRGHLVLQDHGSEVWYRSIKIRELPE